MTLTKHAYGRRRLGLVLSVLSGAIAVVCGAFLPGRAPKSAAHAQDTGASDWGGGPVEDVCRPRCRSGYECRHGECLPVCSPACGPGYLCTAGGTCVRTDAPAPVQSQSPGWGTSSGQCLPSCRVGYVCISGQCVSACNPVCSAGEVCTERGECVPAGDAPPAASTGPTAQPAEPKKEARSSSADSIVNLHFDALGLLQFGITPTLEVGKKFAGYLRVRPLNTGLMSYFVLDHEKDDVFKWGIGGALGLHIFSAGAGNMRGVFGGPALEYVFAKNENRKRYMAVYKTHALIPQLDLGYRWGFDAFLLGVGGRIGLSIPVGPKENRDEPIGINGCAPIAGVNYCDGDRDIHFLGSIFLDLGWFL